MTIYDATSDDEVGIMITLNFQCMSWGKKFQQMQMWFPVADVILTMHRVHVYHVRACHILIFPDGTFFSSGTLFLVTQRVVVIRRNPIAPSTQMYHSELIKW